MPPTARCSPDASPAQPLRRNLVLALGAAGLSPWVGSAWGQPTQTTPKAEGAKPTSALFVSDEWTDCTRPDGSGLYFDVIRAVYEPQGVKLDLRIVPYPRSVQRVKDLEADGWVASYLNEQPFPLYPHYHFDRTPQRIIYLKKAQRGPVSLESLALQRVAWMRGYALDKYIHQPMHITEVDNAASGIQMLDHGRVDFLIMAQSYLDDYVRDFKADISRLDNVFGLNLDLYMAYAPTSRGAHLRQMWDKGMAQLVTTDAFKALYKKYNFPYPFP